ncbi:transposase [Sphingobium sp. EP60837]|uniref:transposase n=1 Tax=Sphingobium sp. EP60837 TaxID=1855519 RepID=UPI0018D2995C
MFKALSLQAQHNLPDAQMEFMIRDGLSWLRFLGLSLGDRTPDENTIRHFRNRLTETGTLKRVMKAFGSQLQKKGYIPTSGQIVDASLVPARKQRNTDGRTRGNRVGQERKGDLAPGLRVEDRRSRLPCELAGILSIAVDSKKPAGKAGLKRVATCDDPSQLLLVAGVGFEPTTFRL